MQIELSIVVPLYNESLRLDEGLKDIREYIDQKDFSCEVVLVNDGSSDDTENLCRQAIEGDDRFRLISYPVNQGKGNAVKIGMTKARGDIRLFTDIDMSVPIDSADIFIKEIRDGNDIVIGTRKIRTSNVIVHQPKYRELLGEAYRRFVRMIFAKGISDFTCGFKAFTAKASDTIFPQSVIKRWSFDTEILFLATRWGFTIKETPVSWTNSEATKVNLLLDVGRSAWELFQIRFNWFVKRYKRP